MNERINCLTYLSRTWRKLTKCSNFYIPPVYQAVFMGDHVRNFVMVGKLRN